MNNFGIISYTATEKPTSADFLHLDKVDNDKTEIHVTLKYTTNKLQMPPKLSTLLYVIRKHLNIYIETTYLGIGRGNEDSGTE